MNGEKMKLYTSTLLITVLCSSLSLTAAQKELSEVFHSLLNVPSEQQFLPSHRLVGTVLIHQDKETGRFFVAPAFIPNASFDQGPFPGTFVQAALDQPKDLYQAKFMYQPNCPSQKEMAASSYRTFDILTNNPLQQELPLVPSEQKKRELFIQEVPEQIQEKAQKSLATEELAILLERSKSHSRFNDILSFSVRSTEGQADSKKRPIEIRILQGHSSGDTEEISLFEHLEWIRLKRAYSNEQNSSEDRVDKSTQKEYFKRATEKNSTKAELFELRLFTKNQHFKVPPCEIKEPHSGLQCNCEKIIEFCNAIIEKKPGHNDFTRQISFHKFKGLNVTEHVVFTTLGTKEDLEIMIEKKASKEESQELLEIWKPSFSFSTQLQEITRFLILNKKYGNPHIASNIIKLLHATIEDAKQAQEPSALYWEAAAYYLGLHWDGTPECNTKERHANQNCSCEKIHTLLKDDLFEKSKVFRFLLRSKEYGVTKTRKQRRCSPFISPQELKLFETISSDLQMKLICKLEKING